MQTVNRLNQKVPFKTGMLVNRVFDSQISGCKNSTDEIRKSIDESVGKDNYRDVDAKAIETDLKRFASRKFTM